MKTVTLEKSSLDACVKDARRERVLVTRNGKPVAVVLGVEGMDQEQVELSTSPKFWKLIAERRKEKTLTEEELDELIARKGRKN